MRSPGEGSAGPDSPVLIGAGADRIWAAADVCGIAISAMNVNSRIEFFMVLPLVGANILMLKPFESKYAFVRDEPGLRAVKPRRDLLVNVSMNLL